MRIASKRYLLELVIRGFDRGLVGALTVYLAFHAGGFFPGTTATVAVALALLLAVRLALMREPWAGAGAPLAVAAAGLASYAAWTLLSAGWSNAPARALLEFDRALLYLLTLVYFGLFLRTRADMRWMLRALAAGIFVVCASGLITRTLPGIWEVTPNVEDQRLSYPVTYWNALGLLASIGTVLCLYLSASGREPAPARVLGAAAIPVLLATLMLTFSRGAIAAGIAGAALFVLAARPRSLPLALLAAGPAAAIAASAALGADLLASADRGREAAQQGEELATVVLACSLGAGFVRVVLLGLDARLARLWPLGAGGVRRRLAAAAGLGVAVVVASMALGLPGQVEDRYEEFLDDEPATAVGEPQRARLRSASSQGRIDEWNVSLDAFRSARLRGTGAGTFQLLWVRDRPPPDSGAPISTVVDAHSLYLEVLGELGIVGLAFLIVALGSTLLALAVRIRGPDRALYAAVLAATLTWAIHAAVDWDWEMPVVTLWVFALGGAALSSGPRTRRRRPDERPVRRWLPPAAGRAAAVVACVVLAAVPLRIAVSQSRLDESAMAFRAGDCVRAVDRGLSSISAVPARPEPFALVGYCDIRAGAERLGVHMLEEAVERDPSNWEFRYGLALVRGAAGIDPRPDIRTASRLNPDEPLLKRAMRRFESEDPDVWRRVARRARVAS